MQCGVNGGSGGAVECSEPWSRLARAAEVTKEGFDTTTNSYGDHDDGKKVGPDLLEFVFVFIATNSKFWLLVPFDPLVWHSAAIPPEKQRGIGQEKAHGVLGPEN